MSADTTLIANLPISPSANPYPSLSNANNTPLQQHPAQGGGGGDAHYVPLNVHSNASYPPPPAQIHQQQQSGYGGQQQPPAQQQHHLPQRDIPMNPSALYIDEQIQPNYIPPPPPKMTYDYMKQYEEMTQQNLLKHEETQKKQSAMDTLYQDLQIPLFVSILFFLFHLPTATVLFRKFVPVMDIENSMGEFQPFGLLLRSLLFGGTFYFIVRAIYMISEF